MLQFRGNNYNTEFLQNNKKQKNQAAHSVGAAFLLELLCVFSMGYNAKELRNRQGFKSQLPWLSTLDMVSFEVEAGIW